MPTMVTGNELLQAVESKTFIIDGAASCAEGIKYDFRLSAHILKASFGGPIDASKLSVAERAALAVEPGEMVFVLSEERLNLPMDMKAELSPKRKLSHAGILVLGGFCIDPGYQGPLLFGLYNFSSTRFPLLPGKKVIAGGPGNPPVVVDETADIASAAKHVVDGASFDNNIVCVVEKVLICVDKVADQLKREMKKFGAYELNPHQVKKLEKLIIERNPQNPRAPTIR